MAAMVVRGRGAGLAEFKRVVRVAVNFLPGPGGGGSGREEGCRGEEVELRAAGKTLAKALSRLSHISFHHLLSIIPSPPPPSPRETWPCANSRRDNASVTSKNPDPDSISIANVRLPLSETKKFSIHLIYIYYIVQLMIRLGRKNGWRMIETKSDA